MATTHVFLHGHERIEARGLTTANGPCVMLDMDTVTLSAPVPQARVIAAALTKAADQADALAIAAPSTDLGDQLRAKSTREDADSKAQPTAILPAKDEAR